MPNDKLHVFISWSGRRSRDLANGLKLWLSDVFSVNPVIFFVSTQDIEGGANWNNEITDRLKRSAFGILCLTPENIEAPWVLFEGGALAMQLNGRVFPLLLDVRAGDLKPPLQQFNGGGADKHGAQRLVEAINSALSAAIPHAHLAALFEMKWPGLQVCIDQIPKRDADLSIALAQQKQELSAALDTLNLSGAIRDNAYLSRVIHDALGWMKLSLRNRHTSPYFDLPLTLYPIMLVSLLREHKPVVNALAVVDAVERFWPQKEGEEIRKATGRESTRVFVFRDRDGLKRDIHVLIKHARTYNVYALSHVQLTQEAPEFAQDFSLIGTSTQPLLSYYHDAARIDRGAIPTKMIRFSTDKDEISRHVQAFSDILEVSQKVSDGMASDDEIDAFVDTVFKPEVRPYPRKSVEMSSYIDLNAYHRHEEEHIYFVEMMEQMCAVIRRAANGVPGPLRILELGAGTGLFTRRLTRIPAVSVTAVEIDWACYHVLKGTMETGEADMGKIGTTFQAVHGDSREFQADSRFHFVVSSFSDHHIHFFDKHRYFKRVIELLEPNGVFMVGDEFLAEHDHRDDVARRQALQAWHGHVIQDAMNRGHSKLAELERDALVSGLEGRGDFKVSCSHFESLVAEARLKIVDKSRIGPANDLGIGGIYVYQISR